MLRQTKRSRPRIRAITLAVLAAAATITGTTSAHATERLPVTACTLGNDTYTYYPPLTLLPVPTKFTGKGNTKAFCADLVSPDGANYLLMEEASGEGLLGCGVSLRPRGTMKLSWWTAAGVKKDTSIVTLGTLFLDIGVSVSKGVVMTGTITAGRYAGSAVSVVYASTGPTPACLTGLEKTSGPGTWAIV